MDVNELWARLEPHAGHRLTIEEITQLAGARGAATGLMASLMELVDSGHLVRQAPWLYAVTTETARDMIETLQGIRAVLRRKPYGDPALEAARDGLLRELRVRYGYKLEG